MPGARAEYIDWDEYFMSTAIVAACRSKDPSTQVGACIVKDNRILSCGYNGAPKGWDDADFPWDSKGEETGDVLQIKNSFVIHAEMNALDHCREDLEGSTLYVTFSPCEKCTAQLAQRGVKRIVYLKKYTDEMSNLISKTIREKKGIIQEPYRADSDEMTKDEYREILNQMQTMVKMLHQPKIEDEIRQEDTDTDQIRKMEKRYGIPQ